MNPICSGSVSSNPNTRLSMIPTAALPLKIANPETVAKKNRYAWIARFRSASSYARRTVPGVGNPPAKAYASLVSIVSVLIARSSRWHG